MKYARLDSHTSILGLATQIDTNFINLFEETPLTYIIEGVLSDEEEKALNTILAYSNIKVGTQPFMGSTSAVGRYEFTLLVARRVKWYAKNQRRLP